ncbi:MAG: DUF3923 family protein [Streptococcus gallolyticus]|uniref:DUF3923 family protein n=1 Tax=Streptococcus gallolyticus TaxID=315405 RepID=A0A927XHB1_9STRE|nr:DUF3923 family protein [Streptococcus gallolyticus]
MTNWQKRFVIWFNLAILFIFLDVTLLIFIRSINSDGVYQTMEMKRLTFLMWTLCYAFVWMCQGVGYMFFKHIKRARKQEDRHVV